jgi:hypothetical protein
MLPSPRKPRLLRMTEGIHAGRTASEPQDRVVELIAQQAAISKVLRAIASSPHVSVEQTQAPYGFPKKAAFVSWRCEGTPFWLVRCGHHSQCSQKRGAFHID